MLSTQGEIKQKVSVKKRRKKGLSLSLAWLLYSSSLACAFIMRTNVCVRSYSFAAVAYPVSTSSLAFFFSFLPTKNRSRAEKNLMPLAGQVGKGQAKNYLAGKRKAEENKRFIAINLARWG